MNRTEVEQIAKAARKLHRWRRIEGVQGECYIVQRDGKRITFVSTDHARLSSSTPVEWPQ